MSESLVAPTGIEPAPALVVIANAPVSFGAFEITIGVDPAVPSGLAVLNAVAEAGYAGIDLGPVGYLGSGRQLTERLSSRSLGLAGGYLELPYSDPERLVPSLVQLDRLLDVFDTVNSHPRPKPTLADAGSDRRRANPGRSAADHSLGFDSEGWKRFADGLEQAVDRCRARGYEPTFHHETGTHIEAPWEIEKVLELTSIGLCLDSGHLVLGGGDPIQALRDWGERINHVHLKDARKAVLDRIVADRAPVVEIWRRRAFCALGKGDVNVDGVIELLNQHHYSGWLVVEQDILPDSADPRGPVNDQRANRQYLAELGL